jgi:Copper amine oxidase N-terminal domain
MSFRRAARPQQMLFGVALVVALTAGRPAAAPAQTSTPAPAAHVRVLVNGSPATLSQPPVVVQGRVLVPLRGVFERLGTTVNWDPVAHTVLAQRGGTTISLQPGSTQVLVNGQPRILDVPPMVIRGQTMVPLRFITQALGAAVTWNAAASTVQINTQRTATAPAPGGAAAPNPPGQGPAAAQAVPATTAVTVTPAARPLGVGDLLTVTATGPANATATYAITGLRTGLLMSESPTQPGTYVGYYMIQPGDRVMNATVVVTMTAPNGEAVSSTASVPVTVNSGAAAAPSTMSAAVINSPAPASAVGTPFTISGTAPPGSRVKVEADYAGSVLFFNIRGTLGTQVVTADAHGNWSATFTQSPPVHGVNLNISAAILDNTGIAGPPVMTIHTTLQ